MLRSVRPSVCLPVPNSTTVHFKARTLTRQPMLEVWLKSPFCTATATGRNGNKTVAGTALEAFARWRLHSRYAPVKLPSAGGISFRGAIPRCRAIAYRPTTCCLGPRTSAHNCRQTYYRGLIYTNNRAVVSVNTPSPAMSTAWSLSCDNETFPVACVSERIAFAISSHKAVLHGRR